MRSDQRERRISAQRMPEDTHAHGVRRSSERRFIQYVIQGKHQVTRTEQGCFIGVGKRSVIPVVTVMFRRNHNVSTLRKMSTDAAIEKIRATSAMRYQANRKVTWRHLSI